MSHNPSSNNHHLILPHNPYMITTRDSTIHVQNNIGAHSFGNMHQFDMHHNQENTNQDPPCAPSHAMGDTHQSKKPDPPGVVDFVFQFINAPPLGRQMSTMTKPHGPNLSYPSIQPPMPIFPGLPTPTMMTTMT
jgi:hypothetical protein